MHRRENAFGLETNREKEKILIFQGRNWWVIVRNIWVRIQKNIIKNINLTKEILEEKNSEKQMHVFKIDQETTDQETFHFQMILTYFLIILTKTCWILLYIDYFIHSTTLLTLRKLLKLTLNNLLKVISLLV